MKHGQHRVAQGQAEGLSRASSLGQLGKEQQHLCCNQGLLPGWQAKPVSASHAAAFCLLAEVWQTDSPFDVCLVSAQHSTKSLSVLLEG